MMNGQSTQSQTPSHEELQKEIRTLRRKLALAEISLERARQLSVTQNRIDTILNVSLKKELQFFKLVLENAINILLLLDFDGRFAYASDIFLAEAGIAGFGLINGSHFQEVLRPIISEENLYRFTEAVNRAVTQKATVSLEEQIDFNFKGSPRTFSIFITPMTDDEGKSSGIMALFNDITEINGAMEAAKRANAAKSDFLANMSHEIRTPMNAIIGMTTIGKSAADTKRKDYCFTKIEAASNHLLGVINDILDMSKIEANKFELAPTEFAFENMLRQAVSVISFRVDEKQQKFRVHVDNAIPAALIGDDQRLAQVITNLLGNAVKFTPQGGSVSLNARFLGEEEGICTVRIAVTDTGIGISKEQQSRLFKSFQQAESSTIRKFGGTGLGLAISKSIVEMMGGTIWVESEPGKGATFAFTVQLRRGTEIARSLYVNWGGLRILTADDDPETLTYVKEITEGFGARCDVAQSGEEALALVRRNGVYDVYIIDWRMPGMDGVQLVNKLKEGSANFDSVVIFISSGDWNAAGDAAKKAGADKFLAKPLFPSDIFNSITESLSAGQRPAKAENAGAVAGFGGKHILLAEDMEINREVVLALLEPTLLEIDCAKNGAEAVEMFNRAPDRYGMIFMDVQMPEMDGYEATRRIRSSPCQRAGEIPIVAMTANVFREDIEKCMASGMSDHVGKPLDLDNVMKVLHKYLCGTREN